MPNVGGKKFSYDAKGKAAAKAEAKKTGKPMTKKDAAKKKDEAELLRLRKDNKRVTAKKKMAKGGMAAKKKK